MNEKYVDVPKHIAYIKPLDLSPLFKEFHPIVDLRPSIRRFGIDVETQSRPVCAVYASTFLREYMYATRLVSDVHDLSEEFEEYVTWQIEKPQVKGGDNFRALDIGYQKWGACPEKFLPQQSQPLTSVPQEYLEQGKKWAKFPADFIKPWDNNRGANQNEIDQAIRYLDQNVPVGCGVLWPKTWKTQIINGVDVMAVPTALNKYDVVFDGHAIALVGYQRHGSFPGGGYFIFRNSWGKDWGDQGYGYMPFEYVQQYANDLMAYKPTNLTFNIGTIKAAQWIHGVKVSPEFSDRLVQTLRKGWGSEFYGKPGMQNWFHISLTTPVIRDGIRPVLTKVFVLYQTGDGTVKPRPQITNLHIYDGSKKVKSFDGLALEGDHSGAIDEMNCFYISPPLTIAYGLGLSVGVSFPTESGSSNRVYFATAGADWNNP